MSDSKESEALRGVYRCGLNLNGHAVVLKLQIVQVLTCDLSNISFHVVIRQGCYSQGKPEKVSEFREDQGIITRNLFQRLKSIHAYEILKIYLKSLMCQKIQLVS